MSEAIQGDSSSTLLVLPMKRGRGRPRKDQSLKRVGRAQTPPGFERVKEIQPKQADRNDATDRVIGQPVTGIVEATFDAGYMLSVKIGDSKTNFRGVVFKPGYYVPVTAENDIAPHVQMTRRNEIPLPIENQVQVHGHNRSVQRAELNGSARRGRRASKGKQLALTINPLVPRVGARGTVVPVVLRPVNLTNGLAHGSQAPQDASQAAQFSALGERGVHIVAPLAMLPPDGSITSSQVSVPICKGPSETQVSHQVALGSGQNEDCPGQGTSVVQLEEVKPIISTNIDKPVEATKGIQGSLSLKTEAKSYEDSHEPPAGYFGVVRERGIGDMNELSSTEPNESVSSSLPAQAISVSKPLMNYGTGRMTELLQAVQDNLMENHAFRAGESAVGLGNST